MSFVGAFLITSGTGSASIFLASPEAKVYDAVHELVEDEMMLYTGDQESIPHDDMLDCMADLTDEEVMARFTPPEGTAVESHEFGTRSSSSKRLFAR